MTFSVKIGSILLLLWLIFAWKSMSSIDCSETALSNTGDVWRFLILRVVRGVLDLAIPEATIQLVAFDVLSLLFFKLERISFEISSDCVFITASCIAQAEFRDWELTTVFIATAFFDGDFSQLMLSVISLTLLWVVVERFLNGNLKFNLTWNSEFWPFFLSLYSWCRIVLTWITSFLLSFRCVTIFFLQFQSFSLVPSIFWYDLFARDFLLYSLLLSLWSSFSLFVSFKHFSAFLCLSFSFSVSSLFSLFSSVHCFFLSAFVKGFPSFGLPISLPLLPLFSFEEVNCYIASLCLQTCDNWCEPSWLPIQKSEPSCQSYRNFEKFLFAVTFLSYQNFWNWLTA